jgi:hypothetical protein
LLRLPDPTAVPPTLPPPPTRDGPAHGNSAYLGQRFSKQDLQKSNAEFNADARQRAMQRFDNLSDPPLSIPVDVLRRAPPRVFHLDWRNVKTVPLADEAHVADQLMRHGEYAPVSKEQLTDAVRGTRMSRSQAFNMYTKLLHQRWANKSNRATQDVCALQFVHELDKLDPHRDPQAAATRLVELAAAFDLSPWRLWRKVRRLLRDEFGNNATLVDVVLHNSMSETCRAVDVATDRDEKAIMERAEDFENGESKSLTSMLEKLGIRFLLQDDLKVQQMRDFDGRVIATPDILLLDHV